jgi:hypothetical protein
MLIQDVTDALERANSGEAPTIHCRSPSHRDAIRSALLADKRYKVTLDASDEWTLSVGEQLGQIDLELEG